MALLELRQIMKEYDLEGMNIHAVRRVDLDIGKGEFISIIGHSGSGKTTLLSIIGGILNPTAGSMFYDGTDVYAMDDDTLSAYRADKVGYIFQFASLMPVLTVKENLLLPSIFSTRTQGQDILDKKALEFLDLVGLADKAAAYPAQLSGGQQRRVAIARSLMNDPDVLLADEPTGDLDEQTEGEVMEFLGNVNAQRGVAVILVTHNLELAGTAMRKLRMTQGKVEEIS